MVSHRVVPTNYQHHNSLTISYPIPDPPIPVQKERLSVMGRRFLPHHLWAEYDTLLTALDIDAGFPQPQSHEHPPQPKDGMPKHSGPASNTLRLAEATADTEAELRPSPHETMGETESSVCCSSK